MTLSSDELTLLRQALCEGIFNDTNDLTPTKKGLLPEVLARVKDMDDSDIMVILKEYQNNKIQEMEVISPILAKQNTDMAIALAQIQAIKIGN